MRNSLAFSILVYLGLAQSVLLITSQRSVSTQISPIQVVFDYNYRSNPGLLRQTAELSAELGTTLMPQIPALTVRLDQPVQESHPLFLTLQSGFSTTQLETSERPQPLIKGDNAVINTETKPHERQQSPLFSDTATDIDMAATAAPVVVTKAPGIVKEPAVISKPASDSPNASVKDAIVNSTTIEQSIVAEVTEASTNSGKQPSETQTDAEQLITSKSFVSTIRDSEFTGYPFNFYDLAMNSPVLATAVATNKQQTANEPTLAFHANTAIPSDKSGEDPNAGNVYARDLPGLLAYGVIHPLVVVIDAGHGGVDPGTIGKQGLLEKDLTLDLVRRLQTLATLHSDIDIVLTRDDADGLSRAERTEKVKASNADLLISLHFNSLPEGDITLVETYYTDATTPARNFATSSKEPSTPATASTTQSHRTSAPADTAAVSRKLARHLQAGVFGAVQNRNPRAIDAGVKRERLFLLAQSGIPSALVELTCLSNEQEEKRLRTEQYRNELAYALMNSLREFVDSETLALSI